MNFTYTPLTRLLFSTLIGFALLTGCSKTASEDEGGNDPNPDDAPAVVTEAKPKETKPKELRVFGSVPKFSLTNQNGDSFDRSQLDGKIWVATFVFTRCGLTCPYQTAAFTKLQNNLRTNNDLGRVQLVTMTVDPEFDTPKVLQQYGRKANADFENWHFLTGDRGDLWDLSKDGFNLNVESARDAEDLIAHSQMLVLVDSQSQIRGYYAALNEAAKRKLRDDIDFLLDQQAPNRKEEVIEISHPLDVRDPEWLGPRAAKQIELSADYNVQCDFKYSDQIASSGITFRDNVVDDVKNNFKAAHYDHGSSVAVADVDNDGLLDIYFVCQLGANELWRNVGDGTFENITERAGVAVPDEVGVGASFADIDNDGDADLYVTRVRAPNKLFRNDGTGRFDDVSKSSGLDHQAHSSGSTFFDYDRDGLLDVLLTNVGKYTTEERGPGGFYVAHKSAFSGHLHEDRFEDNILFRNMGGGRFENVNEQVGFHDNSWSGDATPIDANNDGWLDIYLLNMQGHDQYYENQQGKRFVDKSRELFPKTSWGTMGVKVFDYNRDGQLDLYVTDMHTDMVHALKPEHEKRKMDRNLPIKMLDTDGNHFLGNAFYRKDDANTFTEVSSEVNAENYWPWGISVADLNADGFDDVFIAASMSYDFRYGINSVLLNDHGKRFLDSEFVLGVEPRAKGSAQPWMQLDCSGADSDHRLCEDRTGNLLVWGAIGTRSSVVFDIEGDGDLDIVTHDFGGSPMVLISDLSEKQKIHYLKIQLTGNASNRDGLGAQVTVETSDASMLTAHDGKSGYLSQSRKPLYFGLGDSGQVDRVTVTWPSGQTQVVEGPIQSNQTLTIAEDAEVANQ